MNPETLLRPPPLVGNQATSRHHFRRRYGGQSRWLGSWRRKNFTGAKLVAVNTDGSVVSPVAEAIHLEGKMLRGLGTGGDPERGRELAEDHFERLKSACAGGGSRISCWRGWAAARARA